jgi:hypothetical protein
LSATRRETPDGPTVIIMLDGQPHYLGFRAAELARFLVDHAREVNRDDLITLEFHCNGSAVPRSIIPNWRFKGKQITY